MQKSKGQGKLTEEKRREKEAEAWVVVSHHIIYTQTFQNILPSIRSKGTGPNFLNNCFLNLFLLSAELFIIGQNNCLI